MKTSDGHSGHGNEIHATNMHPDINLSIQFLLNCGPGSCNGGSALHAYQFIKSYGYIPYDTCQSYVACSDDSNEGFCPFVDTTCTNMNTCRTCSRDHKGGIGKCTAVRYEEKTVLNVVVFAFSYSFCSVFVLFISRLANIYLNLIPSHISHTFTRFDVHLSDDHHHYCPYISFLASSHMMNIALVDHRVSQCHSC